MAAGQEVELQQADDGANPGLVPGLLVLDGVQFWPKENVWAKLSLVPGQRSANDLKRTRRIDQNKASSQIAEHKACQSQA